MAPHWYNIVASTGNIQRTIKVYLELYTLIFRSNAHTSIKWQNYKQGKKEYEATEDKTCKQAQGKETEGRVHKQNKVLATTMTICCSRLFKKQKKVGC